MTSTALMTTSAPVRTVDTAPAPVSLHLRRRVVWGEMEGVVSRANGSRNVWVKMDGFGGEMMFSLRRDNVWRSVAHPAHAGGLRVRLTSGR